MNDMTSGPDHSPGAATVLPDIECDDPIHCPRPDPWADMPWARPAAGEPTDGGCE